MTASTVPPHGIATGKHPGFNTTLVSEWTKLRSVRSTWIVTGLAVVLSIGFSAAIALVMGLTSEPFDTWSEADRVMSDPVFSSMPGLLFSLFLLIVLGVMAVSSEYSSGMIRTTFIVNPHRVRVFVAKALIVSLLGIVVHAIAVPGMFLASQAIYGAYGLETASITDSEATRFLLVVALVVPLTQTLIPLSVACLLRGTASAITASMGFFLLTSILGPLLPTSVQQHVLRYLPDIATNSLSGFTPPGAVTYLSPLPASIVVVTWIVGSLVAAAVVLTRRDV
jgi:ABC-2 type transport system permease protein